MGIFTRFRDIVGSNINSMLDRAEDPEKLIRLMIQEMEDTLIELKSACAGVIAENKRVEHLQAANVRRIKYWDDNARLAVNKGRDSLAREALIEKRRYTQTTESLANELAAHEALLGQYQADIRQLEEKLKSAREKERLLIQRHIYATRTKRARQEMRRLDNSDTIFKFEDLEQRIEHMEAEADLIDFGRKPKLEDELERLALDEDIDQELKTLKATSVDKMEERVEALETIIDEREEINHETS
ncbi:MAG: PspA/IM30 family protein [Desulfobacterales bacterium]